MAPQAQIADSVENLTLLGFMCCREPNETRQPLVSSARIAAAAADPTAVTLPIRG
jgi:hypothetical protein